MRQIPGVVTGIVRNLEDPDGRGRILLEFPWLSESERSAWASVAAPMAGKGRGHFFMPEEDDEVLVAFDHGDFAHPFIVGFLWNGVDTPPESTHKNRVIVTPGGHTLRFEDSDGAKKVVLKSSGGHEIKLDDAPEGEQISIRTNGGQSIVLSDVDHSIELRGGDRSLALRAGLVQIS
jgi:uncharacterized protein involved in type VI secretion and phage assembly